MACTNKFNWAYVNCDEVGSSAADGAAHGATGSVQFLTGSGNTTGSANLMFYTASVSDYTPMTMILSGAMRITGALHVTGAIVANSLDIVNTTITEIQQNGSSRFGDSADDTHVFTGSLVVKQASVDVLSASNDNNRVFVRAFGGMYTNVGVASYTASAESYIIGVSQTGNVSLLLPTASACGSGSMLIIKDEVGTRAGSIGITASSGDAIDGEANYQMTGSMVAISMYSNGVNWFIY